MKSYYKTTIKRVRTVNFNYYRYSVIHLSLMNRKTVCFVFRKFSKRRRKTYGISQHYNSDIILTLIESRNVLCLSRFTVHPISVKISIISKESSCIIQIPSVTVRTYSP